MYICLPLTLLVRSFFLPRRYSMMFRIDAYRWCGIRIFTGFSDNGFAVLYAAASANVLSSLQCVLLAGCPRRICSTLLQPVHHLRRGSGYGDGPLHNCVFAGVPEFGVASLVYRFSESDCLGHGQSLHAHVCYSQHGRVRPKSQEDRF